MSGPVSPSALAIFRVWYAWMPSRGWIGSRRICSGVFSATASISTPPSVLAMIIGADGGAIEENGEVKFARDIHGFRDEHLVHDFALGPALVGDQRLAEHLPGDLGGLLRRVAHLHSALEAVLESALSPPAGVDLRFHDNLLSRQRRGDCPRLFGCRGVAPLGGGNSEFCEELLGLVFVDIHAAGLRCPKVNCGAN